MFNRLFIYHGVGWDIYRKGPMDKSIIDHKNYDNVLSRKVILGILTYLFNRVEYEQVINGEKSMIKIPFYYSETGDQQFLEDYFMDTEYYKGMKDCKFHTVTDTMKVPSGILKSMKFGIAKNFMTSQYARARTQTTIDTDFGSQNLTNSVRTTFIPLLYSFDITMVAGSHIEQMKIAEAIIQELGGVRKFFIKEYQGYSMLPVQISFPDEYTMEDIIKFTPGENDQRPKIDFTIQAMTYLPRKIKGSSFKDSEAITTFKTNVDSE